MRRPAAWPDRLDDESVRRAWPRDLTNRQLRLVVSYLRGTHGDQVPREFQKFLKEYGRRFR